METEQEIKQRIEELKWKSLPPFERLIGSKEKLQKEKFGTKARLKELRWYVLSSNIFIILVCLMVGALLFFFHTDNELLWFFIFVLVAALAQKIELNFRLSYLREVRFLKKILKKMK